MTKAKISEYDPVAANNTDVNGTNIAEGCAPSGINNAIREVMAALKRFETGSDGDSVTVGGNLVVSGSTTIANTATLGNVDINGGSIDGAVIGAASAAAGTFTTATATTGNITTVNATTVDTTNIEVTNIKAKDGTAAIVLTDSTGAATISSALTANGGAVFNENGANVDFRVEGDTEPNLLFVDASADAVGIGTSSPTAALDIDKAAALMMRIKRTGVAGEFQLYQGPNVVYLDSAAASGNLAFATVGAERMRIDSSGNVGIGTTSPAYKLDVNGAINTSADLISQGNNARLSLYRSTGINYFDWASGQALYFSTQTSAGGGGRSTQMVIDSSGNVGIGTTSPQSIVHAARNSTTTPTSGTTPQGFAFSYGGGDGYNAGIWFSGEFGGAQGISGIAGTRTTGYNTDLRFYTNDTAAARAFTERMRIDSSGNVGIGTSSPSSLLHVEGTTPIRHKYTGAAEAVLFGQYDATGNASINNKANAALLFGTNNTERARITSGGAFKVVSNGASYNVSTGSVNEINGILTGDICLFVSNQASSNPYGQVIKFTAATPNNTTEYFLNCTDSTNDKCIIYSSGTISNRTGTYNAISDVKLKQDIVDASSQWGDIKALRIVKYRLKDEVAADPNYPSYIGLIAQEVEQVSPGLVDNCPDFEEVEVVDEEGSVIKERRATGTVTKSVKSSILYMKAVKALQEAMARIETLEAEVAALKAK